MRQYQYEVPFIARESRRPCCPYLRISDRLLFTASFSCEGIPNNIALQRRPTGMEEMELGKKLRRLVMEMQGGGMRDCCWLATFAGRKCCRQLALSLAPLFSLHFSFHTITSFIFYSATSFSSHSHLEEYVMRRRRRVVVLLWLCKFPSRLQANSSFPAGL
jgi:hypothetical protein